MLALAAQLHEVGSVFQKEHFAMKCDGRFVIVRAWKNGADMLDPSDSIRVHVDADCGVAFLPHEEMPDWKGSPVIGHVHSVHDRYEAR